MEIKRHIKQAALAFTLLVPGLVQAEVIYPVVEIISDTGSDVTLTANGDGTTDISITGLATQILLNSGGTSTIDIAPDETFTLTGSTGDFSGNTGLFSGNFSISGGLLAGTFSDLSVVQHDSVLPGGIIVQNGSFDGVLGFNSGSLMGNLLSGTLTGNWNGLAINGNSGTLGTAKLEVSAVPVPAAVWLFGSGLLGLVGIARRKSA